MKKFIFTWFVNTAALLIVAHIISGITFQNWLTAVVAALVLGLLNTFLRPILIIITLPLTVVTLGLFTFIINGFLFYIASKLVQGFTIAGFWNAVLGALLFSIVSFVLNLLTGTSARFSVHRPGPQHGRSQGKVIDIEAVPTKDKDDKKKRLY